MFSASTYHFVRMKQNRLVRLHQHRMRTHLGTTLARSTCADIMNQVREFFITWLALNKARHIFWLLLSFALIKKRSKFFISVCPRSTPRQIKVPCLSQVCAKKLVVCIVVTMKVANTNYFGSELQLIRKIFLQNNENTLRS